jgi:hypothetical protein
MKKKELLLVSVFFLIIIAFVISGIIFNDKLIGRSLDFSVPPVDYLVKNNYLSNIYSWWGTMNGGDRNSFGGALIPVNSILYFPLLFGAGSWLIGRYQIILTLFSAMFFFYLFARRLIEDYNIHEKYKITLSIVGSLFFTLNNYFFSDITFGSNAQYFTFSLSPLLAYSVTSYFKYKRKIFFFASFASLFVISSTLQHLIFAYVILVLFSIIYKDYKFFIKIAGLHVLLSMCWVLPLFYSASSITKTEMAVDYTNHLTNSSSTLFSTLFNYEYFANRNLYHLALGNKSLSFVWFVNALILLAVSLISVYKIRFFNLNKRKIIFGFSLMFVVSILFLKGGREPFGSLVLFLYREVPFFKLFRSMQHFLSFYVFAISVLFLFSGVYLLSKNKKFIYLLFLLVIINAMPWWHTRDLGSKNVTSANIIPSYFSQYYLTKGNEKMYELNKLPMDFSVFLAPPGYSVYFFAVGKNEFNFINTKQGKMKSQGGDNGLYYGNKRFFATDGPQNNLTNILNNIEKDMYTQDNFFDKYGHLFSLLGVRYFIVREDIGPVFPENTHLFNLDNVKSSINKSGLFPSVLKEDFVTIAKNINFLPHFYTPESIIISNGSVDTLADIISVPSYNIRSALFFENQNNKKMIELNQLKDGNQILEFKKINPTKYKIKVHSAKDSFPLIFSESFHEGWKNYVVKGQESIKSENLEKYKVLNNKEDDQVSKKELVDYIDKGWVSELGTGKEKNIKHTNWNEEKQKEEFDYIEKYNIDFISKNFNGTIQNDNLANGKIWDTWFEQALPEEKHLIANGYANSWIIETKKICDTKNSKCIINPDGSYDFELIVEFWSQRLFYIGLIISGVFLLSSIIYYLLSRFVFKPIK